MSRSKKAKLIFLDGCQLLAFGAPVFLTGTVTAHVRSNGDEPHYWLLVSIIIAYVAASTLLVWIPLKLAFQWTKFGSFHRGKWCPSMLLYVILSAIPCVTMILVCGKDHSFDFHAHCVELLAVMLMVTDLTEKVKKFKLRSEFDHESGGMLEEITETGAMDLRGSVREYSMRRRTSQTSLVPSTTRNSDNGKALAWNDPRPWVLIRNMLSIYDIRLVMTLADYKLQSALGEWVIAIFVLAIVGMATLVVKSRSKYSTFISVVFLEMPFFFLRFAYLCNFGQVGSILFFLKNLIFFSSFLYFNVIRQYVFESQIFGAVSVNRHMPNGSVGFSNPDYSGSERNRYNAGLRHSGRRSQTNLNQSSVNYIERSAERGHYNQGVHHPNGNHDAGNQGRDFSYEPYNLNDAVTDQQQHHSNADYQHGNEHQEHYDEFDNMDQYDHDYAYNEQQQQHDDERYYQMTKGKTHHRQTVLNADLYSSPQNTQYQNEANMENHATYDEQKNEYIDQQPKQHQYEAEASTQPIEPTYNSVNYNSKQSKRKRAAPGVPSDAAPESNEPLSTVDQGSTGHEEPLPPPPSSLYHETQNVGMVNLNVGPQRVSVRKDLSYTPAIAAQIAKEALNAIAVDAVAKLDDVVENLDYDDDDDSSSGSVTSYNIQL